MKMKRTLMIAGLVAGTGMVAWAQPRGPREMGPVDSARVQAELGIDASQAASLEKIHRDLEKAQIRNRADLQVARMELDELLSADTIDAKAVSAKVQAVTALQAKAFQERIDARLAVRKILTAKQAEQLRKLMRHRRMPRADRGRSMRRPGRGMKPAAGGDKDPALPGDGQPR
jgi:Spy/CpxP family protein refolding chaperone